MRYDEICHGCRAAEEEVDAGIRPLLSWPHFPPVLQALLTFSSRADSYLAVLPSFWIPPNAAKTDQKSILGIILGQDGSREVSRCHLEPTWLQEPISIDFALTLIDLWVDFKVDVARYCNAVES